MARTIVLIHGAWLNNDSWHGFKAYFEGRGYNVVTPEWPYNDGTVEQLRANPNPNFAHVGVPEIVGQYEKAIRALPEPPIIIGHSFGGLTTQILLDRGLGACGVAIDSAPPKGISPTGWKDKLIALRVVLPILLKPFGWKRVITFSFKSFSWGWANVLPEDQQKAAYDRYIVPNPGKPFWQNVLNFSNDYAKVNFKNSKRAPLLLIAGGSDRAIPASFNVNNHKAYQGNGTVTDFKEFPGQSHWTIKQDEQVAQYALDWVEKQIGK